jgi:hypothetical protein
MIPKEIRGRTIGSVLSKAFWTGANAYIPAKAIQ